MERVFQKRLKKPNGKLWNRKCLILSLGMLLSISFLLREPIFATEIDTTKMKLILVDANYGDKIEGAEFTLSEKIDGMYKNVAEITVPEEGYDFSGLNIGEYQLTQTKAPSGYIIGTTVIEFQVTADDVVITNDANARIHIAEDGTYELIVSNAMFLVRLPNTGGTGVLPYTTSGLVLIVAAIVFAIMLQGKKKSN